MSTTLLASFGRQLTKQANPSPPPISKPLADAIHAAQTAPNATGDSVMSAASDQNMNANLLAMARMFGGGAVAAGGLFGLKNYYQRHMQPSPKARQRTLDVVVDVPVDEEKAADFTPPSENVQHNALLGLIASLGAYGAWRGAHGLNKAIQRWDQDKDVDESREEFEKALKNQFTYAKPVMPSPKLASWGEQVGAELDALYELQQGQVTFKQAAAVKVAGDGEKGWLDGLAWNADNPAAAGQWSWAQYLKYWGIPAAAVGGVVGYNHAMGMSKARAIDEARKMKLRQEFQETPPGVFLRPVPAPQEEEQEEPKVLPMK